MKIVYATADASVTDPSSGAPGMIRKGTHWSADDPVVKAHPDLFSEDPRWGLAYSVEPEGWDAPVEQATAAPGERRVVRRVENRG